MQSGGRTRSYRLYMPSSIEKGRRVPVVLNFHALAADGTIQENLSGLRPIADRERFIRSCLTVHRARGIAHTAREVLSKRPSLYSLESHLRALRIPTLLIVGEHDDPCVDVHAFMARPLPGARNVVLPGLGHLTNLEAPDTFNALVREFLDEVQPATAA